MRPYRWQRSLGRRTWTLASPLRSTAESLLRAISCGAGLVTRADPVSEADVSVLGSGGIIAALFEDAAKVLASAALTGANPHPETPTPAWATDGSARAPASASMRTAKGKGVMPAALRTAA